MSISLREITKDNFDDCINLKVAEDQQSFITSNVESIALSKIYPHLFPLAVYKYEELVGFILHGKDPESKNYHIFRIMIDEKFQGKGFGKQATLKLIELMDKNNDCNKVYLFFIEGNKVAENMYLNIGFKRTGRIKEDVKIEMCFDLAKSKTTNNEQSTTNKNDVSRII